jgi:translation initiation factor 2 gamma subunit (eIF-2gamma)
LSAKAQDKKANQERLEAAKKAYEDFKEELDRIDELASSEIPSIVQAIHDTIDEEIETNIKAFSLEVELSLDLRDAKQAWNKFKEQIVNGLRDEDILGNVNLARKNLGTLLSTDAEGNFTGDLANQVEHVNEIMQQIQLQKQQLENVYGDNNKAALEDLKK